MIFLLLNSISSIGKNGKVEMGMVINLKFAMRRKQHVAVWVKTST